MATIENGNPASFAAQLRNMDKSQVLAQELVQQGAVHAISTLLAHGGTKATAKAMLQSLQTSADLIRTEIDRRGSVPLFPTDQVAAAGGPLVEVHAYWPDGRREEFEFEHWPAREDLPATAVRFDIAWADRALPPAETHR